MWHCPFLGILSGGELFSHKKYEQIMETQNHFQEINSKKGFLGLVNECLWLMHNVIFTHLSWLKKDSILGFMMKPNIIYKFQHMCIEKFRSLKIQILPT